MNPSPSPPSFLSKQYNIIYIYIQYGSWFVFTGPCSKYKRMRCVFAPMFAFTFDVGNSTDLYFLQLWIVHTHTIRSWKSRGEEPIFFASGKFHYGLIITEFDLLCKNIWRFSSFFSYFGNFWWFFKLEHTKDPDKHWNGIKNGHVKWRKFLRNKLRILQKLA